MKNLSHLLKAGAGLCALILLTGCFETRDEFTLNPDGSGKVIHECSFQNVNLSGDNDASEDALKEAIGKAMAEAQGVDAWRDVSYKRLDDGRIFFKGTAYFTNLNTFKTPNQSILEFAWQPSGGSAVLSLRTNKNETKNGFKVQKSPEDWSRFSPGERTQKLKQERMKFQQMKPMLAAVMGTMKHEVVFHLPGKLGEISNFTKSPAGALEINFSGDKMVTAMEKLVTDDEWMVKHHDSLDATGVPDMEGQVGELLFGSKAQVRAAVVTDSPSFNYATEVAVARKETTALRQKLGLGSAVVTVAPPANGAPLKNVKIAGVRLVFDPGHKTDTFRAFNEKPGYAVALRVDFPGSILSVTDESGLDSAIADDGTDLLPSSEWERQIHFPKLSEDKASALIEVELKLPGPNVKGLKELSGHLEYRVSSATKEVDLGFSELRNPGSGTELGAQIKSVKKGWSDNGSEQMELKLKLTPDSLKAMYLVVDGAKTELERRGYSGDGTTYAFTYESKTAFPAKGRLVAEVYNELKRFSAPFKLENFSLLGAPSVPK